MQVQETGGGWAQPVDLQQALAFVEHRPATVLAGGTDLFPATAAGALGDRVLDLSRVDQLRHLDLRPWPQADAQPVSRQALFLGAGVTWSQVLRAELPDGLDALKLAAREIGGVQIQNRGTLGGNLCHASAAADSVPVLLALDAHVQLQSRSASRVIPVSEFIVGNRRTVLAPNELLTGVYVPLRDEASRSVFLKLGHRRYLVISAVSVAISLQVDASGRIGHCAIAVGACSAVAQRLKQLEGSLLGLTMPQLKSRLEQEITPDLLAELSPIRDVRGSAEFRYQAAGRLVGRGLRELVSTQ